MTRHVDFYFDYTSPFAYLASTQIERVAALHGASVGFKPFFLGALLNAIGAPAVPIATYTKPKQLALMKDLERWRDHWQVPMSFPSQFPLRTLEALRLTIALPNEERAALMHAIMKLCWVDDRAPDLEALGECCDRAEIDRSLLARIGDPDVKEALRVSTEEAQQAGAPGAPCFVVAGELFWGQDRLHFVEAALAAQPR